MTPLGKKFVRQNNKTNLDPSLTQTVRRIAQYDFYVFTNKNFQKNMTTLVGDSYVDDLNFLE